jgi:putative peptidoglycan lipid II flippase
MRFPSGVASRVRALAFAGVATLVAQELAVAVVLRLANDDGPRGAVTVYNLAWTVFLVPWAVLAVPIATSAFPRLSVHATESNSDAYGRTAAASTRAVLLVTLAAAAVSIAAAEPIARVLAQNGPESTDADVTSLARAIAAFAPGLVGYGLIALLGRALYARGNGRLAASAIVTGWVAVIVADLALVTALSRGNAVPALALGNTVGMVVAGVLLAAAVGAVAPSALHGCARTLAAGLVAAAVGATLGRVLANTTEPSSLLANVGLGILVAAVATLAFVAVVALIDRSAVANMVRRRAADV